MSELPYERGALLPDTAADVAKLRAAWRIVARRSRAGTLYNLTGLERSLDLGDVDAATLDDDVAPALVGDRLTELALEHLGGVPFRDDVFVANRLTAALVAAMQVLVGPGDVVAAVSPSYTHPAVKRAVALAGGELRETRDLDGASLVVLTRLAVSYDALSSDELERVVAEARERELPVFVDDAGGARVGPAVLGQPKTLELGALAGATGLDKYGTRGPRLGLLAGRADVVAQIRARAIELGLEARPMLYPAVVRSLEAYRPERVRELVATTNEVADALERRLRWLERTPVAIRLPGEGVLAEAAARAGRQVTDCNLVAYEATAALAMILLRDHGVLTVHFAALPPGTSALLLKFLPPETLARLGGPERLAAAVDESLEALAELVGDRDGLARLLMEPQPREQSELPTVVGVDGSRAGWLAIVLGGDGTASARVFPTFADVLALDAAVVAVDIPIGVLEDGRRSADADARRFVGGRSSSVFTTPTRAALTAPNYAEALESARATMGVGISKQSFALARRIVEVEELAGADERVVEVHPEVSFAELADAPLAHSKHTAAGLAERRALLRHAGITVPEAPPGAREDDLLDAAAAAWTARRVARGEARSLPEAHGARIGAIWR